MKRPAFLAAFVTAVAATAAVAQDQPDAPKADAPAPAADRAAETSPGAGERIRVKLRSGRAVEGVVLAKGTWERRDTLAGWVAAKRDEKHAGVRLWWTNDLDGFMWIPVDEIIEWRSLGIVTEEQTRELARLRSEERERAAADRAKLDHEKAREDDAATKARSLVEEVEAAKREAEIAALMDAKRKTDAEQARRWAELLAKFPPDRWSLETPKEIERRKVVLHLFPSEDEIEFLRVFDEWSAAFEAWKTAQANARPTK